MNNKIIYLYIAAALSIIFGVMSNYYDWANYAMILSLTGVAIMMIYVWYKSK